MVSSCLRVSEVSSRLMMASCETALPGARRPHPVCERLPDAR
jgi:hypothetical protein